MSTNATSPPQPHLPPFLHHNPQPSVDTGKRGGDRCCGIRRCGVLPCVGCMGSLWPPPHSRLISPFRAVWWRVYLLCHAFEKRVRSAFVWSPRRQQIGGGVGWQGRPLHFHHTLAIQISFRSSIHATPPLVYSCSSPQFFRCLPGKAIFKFVPDVRTHPHELTQPSLSKQAIERVCGGEAWLLRGGITMAATVMKQEMRPNGGPRVSNYPPSSRTTTTDKGSSDSRKTFQQVSGAMS